MYDSTTLFKAGSNQTNGRYMYHSMDATIGQTTNNYGYMLELEIMRE